MKFKTSRTIALYKIVAAAVVLLFLLCGNSFGQEAKKRIAILDFDFDAIQHWWEGDWNVGDGIADILVTKFFEEGSFVLVDRQAIDEILKEQDMSNSSRFDASSAAQLGKLLGADALVTGAITQFGTEKKSTGGIGGLLGSKAGAVAGLGMKKGKAKCVIDARLIDVNTGVILSVAEGEGESSRKGLLLGGVGYGESSAGGGVFNMTSSGFRETILGEATNRACSSVVAQIAANADKITQVKLEISGLVADYDAGSGEVTITPGREKGIAAGQIYEIKRVYDVVKHPVTGEVIREKANVVGKIKITDAGDGYAVGTMIGGGEAIAGDKVKIYYEE